MSGLLADLQGTPAGHTVALWLALAAAILHALFGALQKGRHDPWLSRMSIDASYALMAAPFALFVVPWPEPFMWPIFGVVFVIHAIYKLLQAGTYQMGAYTAVYPVVRGTGPLFTVIGASIVFGEHFTALQWLGVATLVAGILGLGAYNMAYLNLQRDTLPQALILAVFTGLLVACYTTYDAYGIRATADPFTFLAWFFLIDGFNFAPFVAWRRHRELMAMPDRSKLMWRGVIGGLVAFGSFGAILLATRLDKVGEAAVLRETSVVFSALIGWLLLGEKVGRYRMALLVIIAAGAVIVEFGS